MPPPMPGVGFLPNETAYEPVTPVPGVFRLALSHALIVANRQALKLAVLDAIDRGEATVVLDTAHCGYIDASGLGVLVSLSKKCRQAGGSLTLANVSDDMRFYLELTRMDTILTLA